MARLTFLALITLALPPPHPSPPTAVPSPRAGLQQQGDGGAKAEESEQILHAQALDRLGVGWEFFHHEGLLVLHQDREKDARRAAEQANAVLEWLEERFGYLAPDAYVRRPILRYFGTPTERRSWPEGWTSRATWLPGHLEVLVAWDEDGEWGFESGYMNANLVHHWIQHKDPALGVIMPPWFYRGIADYLGNSRLNRYGKFEFRLDDWTRDYLVVQTQRDRGWKPIDVFERMTEAELGDEETMTFRERYCQTDALVRYLLTDGNKKKPTRGLLDTYLTNLQELSRELEGDLRAEAEKLRAEDEASEEESGEEEEEELLVGPEEEDARWRREAALEMEPRVVRELFQRTFAAWKETDWKKFAQAYSRYLK